MHRLYLYQWNRASEFRHNPRMHFATCQRKEEDRILLNQDYSFCLNSNLFTTRTLCADTILTMSVPVDVQKTTELSQLGK
mmetsp:Transcript_28011/g.67504  ORF Transcript_28011/g.67504 Transcript_28011/m.67504 type:complete len:80 (-) Transcript_28011:158-397(-)